MLAPHPDKIKGNRLRNSRLSVFKGSLPGQKRVTSKTEIKFNRCPF